MERERGGRAPTPGTNPQSRTKKGTHNSLTWNKSVEGQEDDMIVHRLRLSQPLLPHFRIHQESIPSAHTLRTMSLLMCSSVAAVLRYVIMRSTMTSTLLAWEGRCTSTGQQRYISALM